jgi:hypothetical protein
MFETPILFLIFNRPEISKKTFNVIRIIKPKYLFIAADGPREGIIEDISKCEKTRKNVLKEIDWECEVSTLFRSENKGCGKGPAEAITWFFNNVAEGIILEDDCLPHLDFFPYCQQLLQKYRNSKVSFIGGTNFQDDIKRGDGSYYFSAGHHATWGWASWRSKWIRFDYYLENIDNNLMTKTIKFYFNNIVQRNYWISIFQEVRKNRYFESCWDYQFYFSCWLNRELAIVPNSNLISNCGFNEQATHTFSIDSKFAENAVFSILPLIHPSKISQNKSADTYLHRKFIEPHLYGFYGLIRFPFTLNKLMKRIFHIEGSWFNYFKNKYVSRINKKNMQ